MMRHFFVFFLLFCTIIIDGRITCCAQNNTIEEYEQFKRKAQQKYEDFRQKCNAEYAEFLKQVWESYQAGPVLSKPKEKTVPPVVMPEEEIDNPISPKPVPIDTVVPVVNEKPVPQPIPIAPIREQPQPVANCLTFTFFGTEGKVRIPQGKPKKVVTLGGNLTGNNISDAWNELSNGDYDNLIRDCLELRIRYGLCDWAYLQMIRELSERYYDGRNNAATMLMAWICCQTGYQMRLAVSDGKLYLLIGSQHVIYGMSYWTVEGTKFYPFLHEGETLKEQIQICGASFPGEQPMSLYLFKAQTFAERLNDERTVKSKRYPEAIATYKVNQNLMDFYATYPTSMFGENFCTRWAMYANTPMAENIRQELYPQLKRTVEGKNQLAAVNILLNWVQTGFVYEYDDKVWGDDRAFFAEESLNYPYCDCEDRSILFTRLVRDLLGLKCLLVYYPGHLACAVQFTEPVTGDYITLNGKTFIVADPTYIGAPVGCTMPDMDNKTAKVILLD